MRCLVPQGHLDSALLELQLAQQVDPFSAHVILNRGRISYFKRDFALAIEAFRKVMELEPAFEVVPLPLAEAYLESLRLEEGFKTLQDASAPTGDEARLALLGRGYGLSEQPHRARQVLRQLKEVARHQHVSGYYLSQVHLALGETSPAMDWLERAASERSPVIAYVGVAPQFDALRPDPRFRALLKRIGID